MMTFPKIYLASGSPRRSELLAQIGVNFSVLSVGVDETRLVGETPVDYVQRVAIAKAQAGWDSLSDDFKPVLGADTSVVLGDVVLGKPVDTLEARAMLVQLSGHTHEVMTAVALVTADEVMCELCVSEVTFRALSDADLDWYVATGEGVDKAGSYAVQGLGALFISEIKGSYSAVMGLPLLETGRLLQAQTVKA
jgi:septum formation protein